MTIPQLPADAEQEYYKKISKIESNDNPKAKAKTSSASGRFQFIKSTWEELGYDFDDVFNDNLQYEAIEKFTRRNAEALIRAGCAVNHATLYGSHFLGVAGFLKVMRGTPGTAITVVTSEGQRKANPSILSAKLSNGQPRTIKDFTDWLERKTGDSYTKRYIVAPPEPVIVHEPEPDQPKSHKTQVVGFVILVFVVIGIVTYFVTR
jgi:hypothetical protein